MASLILAVPTAIAVLYTGLQITLRVISDPLEPPAIANSFPFLEPLFHLALLKKKSRYFVELKKVHDLPMFVYLPQLNIQYL